MVMFRVVSVVLVVTLLVCGAVPPVSAQQSYVPGPEGKSLSRPSDHSDEGQWERGFKILGDDAVYLATSPFRLTPEGLLITGLIAAKVAGVAVGDKTIRNELRDRRHDTIYDVANGVTQLGNAPVLFGLNVGFVLTGELIRQSNGDSLILDAALAATEAQILAAAITEGISYATARTGPNSANDPFKFKLGQSSFPSAHTSQAFAVATVLNDRFDQPVGAIAYTLAAAVGLSRIVIDKHWASDVVAGAALGWAIGHAISKRRSENPPYLSFFPFIDPGTNTYWFMLSGGF
jgi:membrane-associated phospholipid phosphatase